jgi:hypothetical protein
MLILTNKIKGVPEGKTKLSTQVPPKKNSTQRHGLPVRAWLQRREPGDIAARAGASNGFCLPT